MREWNLRIELKSDFCTATGENAPGMISSKTALEYGIPKIPAKRIKGCLLESGRELADNGMIAGELLSRIFGCPGSLGGEGIRVGDGHLSLVPEYLFNQEKKENFMICDYEQFLKNVKDCQDIEDSLLEDIFTRKRTRTALEQTGTASAHSLRTVQVVPSGLVFCSRIEGSLSQEEEQALLLCAKGLRHMGIGITRGMGEVRCTLEEAALKETGIKKESTALFQTIHPEQEVSLPYEIKLKLPIILEGNSGEVADQIQGSAILGAFAGMYIKKYLLGANAHKDADFCRIFLRDGVQFGNAFLKKDGREYVPCPKAFAVLKDDRTVWFNTMKDEENRRRKNISEHICLKDGCLYKAAPDKEIHFHHARPADRAIGHAQNDRAEDKKNAAGQFFQYMALSAEQVFTGTLRGKAGDIQRLVECLEENGYCLMLGKSRTAEYGSCEFHITKPSAVERKYGNSACGKDWLVWLISPFVSMSQESGLFETEAGPLMEEMSKALSCSIKLEHSICSCTVLQGYNGRWRLPSAPNPALAPGSAFHIKTDRDVEAWEIEEKRWGMMTGKGCGQVKAMPWKDCQRGIIVEGENSNPDQTWKGDGPGEEDGGLLAAILEYQRRRFGWEEDAGKVLNIMDKQGQELPSSSDIVLLIQLLKERDGKPGTYKKIKEEVERIRGEEKKQRILTFIKPCEGESVEFIERYLEAAKWKARREENHE